MKVVVMNYTGTVGKTTVAAHLLAPRMSGTTIYAIESINETAEDLGLDVEKLRGNKFRELFKKLMLDEHAIIDVGASNVEDFITNLEAFDEAHKEIDYYVIPVTSGTKEQKETIAMISSLATIGVPPYKIRILFNRVEQDAKSEFAIIANYFSSNRCFWFDYQCAIFETELFDAVSIHRLTLSDLLNDESDYKALLKDKAASPKDRARWSDIYGLQLLAKGVSRKLDSVFEKLFTE